MPPFRDLTGQRFGRWLVLGWHSKKYGATQFWRCQCDCGTKTTVVNGDSLKKGTSVSCGCYALEIRTIHGMEKSPTYFSWMGMKQRCQNPKAPDYERYGGRGITVCDQWQEFVNFLADMGKRPKGKTLGRIDNDGPYEPGNCQWETSKQQDRNKHNTVYLEFEGRRKPLTDWADQYGVPRKALANRLKQGWSLRDALTQGSSGRWGKTKRSF